MTGACQASASRAPGEKAGVALNVIRHRRDFVRVSRGRRFFLPELALQAAKRAGEDPLGPARFGFTVTKKTGTAVERNRMRRRLREAMRRAAAIDARAGCDYVIVARRESLSWPFDALVADIGRAIAAVNEKLDDTRAAPERTKRQHGGSA